MQVRKSFAELNGERVALVSELEGLYAKSEGDGLSDEEQTRFNKLVGDDSPLRKLDEEIREAATIEARMAEAVGAKQQSELMHTFLAGSYGPHKGGHSEFDSPEPLSLQDERGNWHRSAAATQEVFKPLPAEAPSSGELLAFWATNDPTHLHGKDPMAATTGHSGGSSGGFVLPSTISGQLIDKARAAMVAGRAGIRTITLDSAELTIVKVASDPTGGYYHELSTIQASQPTFSRVVLRPHKYSVLIPISREAIEDGENLPGMLQSTATQSISHAIDLAVLRGDGTDGSPRGITATTGVNKIEGVGTPTSYSDILGAVRRIKDANFGGDVSELAWIHSPREWETYAGLVTTGSGADGQPLMIPPAIEALPAYTTTSMPVDEGGGAESSMIVGHFPSAVLAFRTGSASGVQVEFLNAGTAADAAGRSINAVADDAQWLRFTVRFDVAVLRPDHFTVLSGVTA